MRLRVVLIALATTVLASGTARAEDPAGDSTIDQNAPGQPGLADDDRPRGSYVIIPPEDLPVEHGVQISRIIFLNRCAGGCTITPGSNDARTNKSSIVQDTVTLSEFEHGDAVWNDVMACVREVYLPFDVEITDVDPGMELFHHEAIVAGTAVEAGLDPRIGGIAPLAGDCRAIDNVISFSFANQYGPNALEICWTAAQETAHAFGLDHEFDCRDPMTYIPGCGQKFFRDEPIPCGETGARQCACGGSLQNSHRKLMTTFGAGENPPPPVTTIQLPADGASVAAGFSLYAFAADKRGVKRVEYLVNGYKWLEKPGHSDTTAYNFLAPDQLPDGYLDVEIRAFNDLEVPGSAFITVLKGAPCTSADSCLGGQSCNDGRCAWPAPTGELGDECNIQQDCISDLCPENGGEKRCSELCNPQLTDQCGMEFDCLPAGNSGVCWPAEGEGGGCCSVGADGRAPWAELALFGLLLGVIVRRRRR
ncbi:MAG TPA: Ig-like domain-containing protein [Kofleriaceae bacterium]|nr:Ig-like domain-containing protein [Kofleriaceae bacterium]